MPVSVDFIGIGAPRCGTSWLANILRSHPEICLSEPKEVRYFNRQNMAMGSTRGHPNPNADKPLAWYLAHFAHAGENQVRGEFTPVYLYDEAAAAVIHETIPSVRLILSLRNPVDRAYSHYWQRRRLGLEAIASFEQAMEPGFGYLESGLYARSLHRFLRYFDKEQVYVTIFEDLIRSPAAELDRLYRFLGVPPESGAEPTHQDRNAPHSLRSRRLQIVARRTSQALSGLGLGALQRSLRRRGAYRLWRRLMSKPGVNPTLPDSLRERLASCFTDDIAELERLLGRDLDIWRSAEVQVTRGGGRPARRN